MVPKVLNFDHLEIQIYAAYSLLPNQSQLVFKDSSMVRLRIFIWKSKHQICKKHDMTYLDSIQ